MKGVTGLAATVVIMLLKMWLMLTVLTLKVSLLSVFQLFTGSSYEKTWKETYGFDFVAKSNQGGILEMVY